MEPTGNRSGFTLGDLLAVSAGLGQARFLQRYQVPCLIQLGLMGKMREESTGFRTLIDSPNEGTPTEMRVKADARVWFVQKTQTTFPDKISIGRSRNNDVTVDDANVSKLHGYLTPRDGTFALIDAESRNGTGVDGVRIPTLEPVLVQDGQVLHFGPTARVMFCTPESLWTLLCSGLVQ